MMASEGVGTSSTEGAVTFVAGDACYEGEFLFRLPSRLDPATLPGVALIAAFNGPDGAVKPWFFEILNLVTGRYETIGDSADARAGEWNLYEFHLAGDLTRYISGNNRAYVRYGCDGPGGRGRRACARLRCPFVLLAGLIRSPTVGETMSRLLP